MIRKFLLSAILLSMVLLSGCTLNSAIDKSATALNSNSTTTKVSDDGKMFGASAPLVVYKTKHDYSDKVSVSVDSDKKIVRYPGATDAVYQKPIKLEKGYLLKKMPGNVFLSVSIDDFVKSGDWRKYIDNKYIIDYDPFTELYNCNQVAASVEQLNRIIINNELEKCQKISLNIDSLSNVDIVDINTIPDSFTRRECPGNSLPMPKLYKKDGKYYWDGVEPYLSKAFPGGHRIQEISKEEYIRDYLEDQGPCSKNIY